MNWIYGKYREMKLRRRTARVLRSTSITLTERERKAVSSDTYIYWELKSWPDTERAALCACLWALVHTPSTFEHYRPTNMRAAWMIIPDPALRECDKGRGMSVAEADYSLLRKLYEQCRKAGVKTCTVHNQYRGPAPQPERTIRSNETHKIIPYHHADEKRANVSQGCR